MRIYQLDENEVRAIDALNAQRTNELLIVCGYPGGISGVVADDLNNPIYAPYKALLNYDENKIIEIEEPEELF